MMMVDVVIPAYRGRAETVRCIESVLSAPVHTPHELIVIDDASPDAALASALDALAADGRITLLRNSKNLGFVASANIGMRLHAERDVVLLNADAEVFGDWLDRLRRACDLPGVGTVTPFSNNAEICSYPRFLHDNAQPLELSDAELDALFAAVNAGEVVDLPTAVGFCMYVKRACLDEVGFFDESTFGAGYGEENDFSRRALGQGWRSVLAADVFVRHRGGVSFGESRAGRSDAAFAAVTALYPDYPDVIARFIGADPIERYRSRIDLARLRRRAQARTYLLVTHSRGGGTERHVVDLARRIENDGGTVLICRAVPGDPYALRFESLSLALPNLPVIDVRDGVEALAGALRVLGVTRVHIHHLVDLPAGAPEALCAAAERLAISYDFTLHDYLLACPRIHLIDASGFYCGEPEELDCTRCLSRSGSEFGVPSIWGWRERSAALLRGARRVFVPDGDAAVRFARYFPTIRFTVRPCPDAAVVPLSAPRPQRDRPSPESRRRVGLIGEIYPLKGSQLLLQCARLALESAAPIDFIVIGYTDIDDELRAAGVNVTGWYDESDLQHLLAEAQLDLAWFPAVWPETYGFTLSEGIRAGLFPVVFDIGALATRLRALDWGCILPIEYFFQPQRTLQALLDVAVAPFPATSMPEVVYPEHSFIEAFYGQ